MIMFNINGRLKPVKLKYEKGRIFLSFSFNKALINEIKAMGGSKWHPEDKIWSIDDSDRNQFNLEYLQGENPYERWEKPLLDMPVKRNLYKHQKEAFLHLVNRRRCILAGEMGVGKTLVAIEAMELSHKMQEGDWLWVAPKSAIAGVKLEFQKWGSPLPEFSTYSSLRKLTKTYRGIVFDECQRLKNFKTIRSEAAHRLANKTREDGGFIFLLSGTPAPKNPCDWWNICELAAPGFLKEGSSDKLKYRLGKITFEQGLVGNSFPRLVNWFDRAGLCLTCGEERALCSCDTFIEAKNEVLALGKRMRGLVIVQFKADCLDLPEKIYERRVLEISPTTKRLITLVKTSRAVETLGNLRMLSDGFQYKDEPTGDFKICPVCEGRGLLDIPGLDEPEDCRLCSTSGEVPITKRSTVYIGSPKEQELLNILDEHDDIGRLVVFGGYQGSIDLIIKLVKTLDWDYIKVDGRGWTSSLGQKSNTEYLKIFQEGQGKICFIAQAGSGGTGITLTASPTIVYYSNSFNAEDRMQSEDRIHRVGMDKSKGAKIIDLIHLSTDELVLDNLQKKKDLQTMSMVKLKEYLEEK